MSGPELQISAGRGQGPWTSHLLCPGPVILYIYSYWEYSPSSGDLFMYNAKSLGTITFGSKFEPQYVPINQPDSNKYFIHFSLQCGLV